MIHKNNIRELFTVEVRLELLNPHPIAEHETRDAKGEIYWDDKHKYRQIHHLNQYPYTSKVKTTI